MSSSPLRSTRSLGAASASLATVAILAATSSAPRPSTAPRHYPIDGRTVPMAVSYPRNVLQISGTPTCTEMIRSDKRARSVRLTGVHFLNISGRFQWFETVFVAYTGSRLWTSSEERGYPAGSVMGKLYLWTNGGDGGYRLGQIQEI